MVLGLMEVIWASSLMDGSFSSGFKAPVKISCLILSLICSKIGFGLLTSTTMIVIPPPEKKYQLCIESDRQQLCIRVYGSLKVLYNQLPYVPKYSKAL